MEKPKEEKNKEQAQKKRPEPEEHEFLVRIKGYDIPGSKNILTGLTKIKGVSWAISNAVCLKLKLPKDKKIADISKDEIKKIESFLEKLELPAFMKNRRSDPVTGEEGHFYGHELKMKKDFDIKRMRKMKSYKGIRHGSHLPVRGQRTRSNFRKGGIAVGVKKKAVK